MNNWSFDTLVNARVPR